MKTSIVIPVYNVQDYLAECVSSALKLHSEIEILLIDDGSTDNSGRLCDKMALEDERIRVIHQENGGLSAARNTGILNSVGQYVLFLDSDDFLNPVATDELLSYVNSGADVLMGLYRNYYTVKDMYEEENSPTFLKMEGLISIDRFLDSVPTDGQSCYMIACRFIVKRELIFEKNLLFMSGIYHEDEEWTQRMLCGASDIYVSHLFFYQYRQDRCGAITFTVKPKNVWDTATIMKCALQEREKYENASGKYEYLSYRAAQQYLNIMIHLNVLDEESKKEVRGILTCYRKQCNPYFRGKIGILAKVLIAIFGISIACKILQLLKKIVAR